MALSPFISAHAVFGPTLLDSERPHSVCAIEYFAEHSPTVMDEVCSVVIIGPNHGLTAGHCLPGLPERPHRVLCRDQQETQITHVLANRDLELERLRYGDEYHRFDSALVEFSSPLEVQPLTYSQSREQTLEAIENAEYCAIMGHGGFRESLRRAGLSTNARLTPDQLVFDGDLIRVHGYGGLNSGLVEPGDSGGSLACVDHHGEWTHLAQVSGRTMSAVSLFAPTDLLTETIEDAQISLATEALPGTQERLAQQRLADLERQLTECEKHWLSFMKVPFERGSSLDEDLQRCLQQPVQELRRRVSEGQQVQVKVKTFSLIHIEQKIESLQLTGNRPLERYLNHPNPFSTVDHFYNRFLIRRIEGDRAIGDLTLYGYAESFSCMENILCDGGLLKNVEVALEDLLITER